ncbi:hypothetical protein L207DRAFT_583697 [Hyaloscypha variabilis F]|uniref:ATP-grasp domain-containing protein n=1 Tax=Hyaloscypha variabilis (strain UAMH 11265 / GT02V1 / F) TaxID=1149755 RepID=A0A2J6RMU9_HYAVF|nr:hypothetical protein L207DRAFT_583697 [Hyaloscypha variabilis F]
MSSASNAAKRIAILYQASPPPPINGINKPMKPGGYQDSGADIAYTLSKLPYIQILTPKPSPSPLSISDWCFPDTESGILSAIKQGATHLWANTILFCSHPLQTSALLDPFQDTLQIIGQPPNLVEKFDDKEYVNNILRKTGKFTLPRGWSISKPASLEESLSEKLKELDLPYPVVGKPVRGRGSYGVKVCSSLAVLEAHVSGLLNESPTVMIEEFLVGEEATVTVMPPSKARDEYWALPIVTRFNHVDGVAPWNGVVAVTANSRFVSEEEYERDERYGEAARECEGVAKLLSGTAPIRIDIRRFKDGKGEKFALFDVNMKPNITGPGRPGRDDQDCLMGLAAKGLGWDYERLLVETLGTARSLRYLRGVEARLGE